MVERGNVGAEVGAAVSFDVAFVVEVVVAIVVVVVVVVVVVKAVAHWMCSEYNVGAVKRHAWSGQHPPAMEQSTTFPDASNVCVVVVRQAAIEA